MSRSFTGADSGHPPYYWWKQEPKWSRKVTKHRKRRAACRVAAYKCLYEDPVEVIWPLNKRPHLYFW